MFAWCCSSKMQIFEEERLKMANFLLEINRKHEILHKVNRKMEGSKGGARNGKNAFRLATNWASEPEVEEVGEK